MSDAAFAPGSDWLASRATLSTDDCLRTCDDAILAGAKCLISWPVHARALVRHANDRIEIESLIAYPMGSAKPVIKAIEATNSVKDGVRGVAVAMNPANLVRGDLLEARNEMLEIVRGVRASNPHARVTAVVSCDQALENRFDIEAVIRCACVASREGAADALLVIGAPDPTRVIDVFVAEGAGLFLRLDMRSPDGAHAGALPHRRVQFC